MKELYWYYLFYLKAARDLYNNISDIITHIILQAHVIERR